MTIKYDVHGGWMWSKNDRDMHFIPSYQVAYLYGVPRSECALRHGDSRWPPHSDPNLIQLYPDYHGDYDLEAVIARHEHCIASDSGSN